MSKPDKMLIDRELAIIDAQLELLRKQEVEYQRLMEDVQRLKNGVLDERSSLVAKAKDLQALSYPINWLPPELLIKIFTYYSEIPYDDPTFNDYCAPTLITHVCRKWRNVALNTPHLWSRLLFDCDNWSPHMTQTFLRRSGTSSLNIVHIGSSQSNKGRDTRLMLVDLYDYRHRLDSMTVKCRDVEPIKEILCVLKDQPPLLSNLQSMSLTISNYNPHDTSAYSLYSNFTSDGEHKDTNISCRLKYLKIENVPLTVIPRYSLAGLRRLHCSFSAKGPTVLSVLRLSKLGSFLAETPLLEELTLVCTTVIVDVQLFKTEESLPGTRQAVPHSPPFDLKHLKAIELSVVYPIDLRHVLAFLRVPSLEKLDLWVSCPTRSRLTSDPDIGFTHSQELSSLRDLSIQWTGDEVTVSILRKFTFHHLEKVELANIDRKQCPLPELPRLETLFRDPRLTHLTHLIISHFEISPEIGRAQAMLGYMPFLASLSFDACTGVGRMMEGLQEKLTGTIWMSAEGKQTMLRRGVKVCPRLDTLSFWGCEDLCFENLRAVVLARNEDGGCAQVRQHGTSGSLNGEIGGITEEIRNRTGGNESKEVMMGRIIRPLRKVPRQGQSLNYQLEIPHPPGTSVPSTKHSSSLIAKREVQQSAQIIYVLIKDCGLIDKEEALSLKDMGVLDVMWGGSESG